MSVVWNVIGEHPNVLLGMVATVLWIGAVAWYLIESGIYSEWRLRKFDDWNDHEL